MVLKSHGSTGGVENQTTGEAKNTMPLLFSPMMVDVANGTIITVITTPTKVIEPLTVPTKPTSAPWLSMTSKHPFDI